MKKSEKKEHNKEGLSRAQSIIEYCLLIATILMALMGMKIYGQRGLGAYLKRTADQMAPHETVGAAYEDEKAVWIAEWNPNTHGRSRMKTVSRQTIEDGTYKSASVTEMTNNFSGANVLDILVEQEICSCVGYRGYSAECTLARTNCMPGGTFAQDSCECICLDACSPTVLAKTAPDPTPENDCQEYRTCTSICVESHERCWKTNYNKGMDGDEVDLLCDVAWNTCVASCDGICPEIPDNCDDKAACNSGCSGQYNSCIGPLTTCLNSYETDHFNQNPSDKAIGIANCNNTYESLVSSCTSSLNECNSWCDTNCSETPSGCRNPSGYQGCYNGCIQAAVPDAEWCEGNCASVHCTSSSACSNLTAFTQCYANKMSAPPAGYGPNEANADCRPECNTIPSECYTRCSGNSGTPGHDLCLSGCLQEGW